LENIVFNGLGASGGWFMDNEYLFIVDHVINDSLVEVVIVFVTLIAYIILPLFDDIDDVDDIRIVFNMGH
jgi:exosortase/archaeosortase